ncbi:MAG: hypothetical protein C5B59_01820 [Bacteroidetes bacterium]|nr:MAG: hypothetical protein C5B59_01820 [Bacteroidota bacterium]
MSCASGYKSISPETLEYHNQSTNDKIEFSYHYDVLRESRNKKYAKHELKNNLSLVAVKITNRTGHDINPMTDAVFYIANKPAYFVDQRIAEKKIRQGVPIYLLYLLLSPVTFNTTSGTSADGSPNTNSFPIGLIVGPALAGTNMIIAGTANKSFKDEIENYSLYKQVHEGETIFALVAFKDIGKDEISLRLK